MSKLMWKSLIISPAVLGAMLLVAAGRVRAADSNSLFTANNPVSQEASQLQTAEVQAPEVQSQELDTTFKSDLTSVVAPTAPVAQNTTVLSTTATQAAVEPKVGEVEVPASNKTVAQVTQVVPTNPDNVLDPINQNSPEDNSNALDQVTNVSQLRDVSPGDWAYEALRSLVERYGCIAGYPDGTFRGNRATTRYEFAAGLNACLNQVERLITSSTEGFVRRQDLETLQRLVSEFRTELTALGGRVDTLEGRTAFLEERQFSTTTK
ncbi:MAG: iron uptake porin, partial [Cyanobacteriota bacterium]|nr:iron uptake porin [Cyanobacteriota bacterium]